MRSPEDLSIPWIELPSETREFIAHRTRDMAESLFRLSKKDLYLGWRGLKPDELGKKLYEAPFVLVAQNTDDDPLLNYGNQSTQNLWEMPWEELITVPSRKTAEAPDRDERERFLNDVKERGYSDDYQGVRISKSGKRFRIGPATVWNISDDSSNPIGLAATFKNWEFL